MSPVAKARSSRSHQIWITLMALFWSTDVAADGDGTLDADSSFAFAQLPDELAVSLIVRGPLRVRAKRRGGRRARQGVTPLFSSSPPRRR